MKPELKNKIERLVDKISNEEFSSSDVALLMTYLRSELNSDKKLLDITNFVTHAEGRNQGESLDYTKSFVNTIINTFEKTGQFKIPGPLFVRKDVFNSISKKLSDLSVLKSSDIFASKEVKFIDSILDLITDTHIDLKQSNIEQCMVKREGDKIFVQFKAKSNHPIFGGTHAFRLFD